MTDKLKKAVEEFLEEADRRELDRYGFFNERNISWARLGEGEESRCSIVVHDDGGKGTVLPPIRQALGLSGVNAKIVSVFYEVSNHNMLDPIVRRQIVKLPTVSLTPKGEWRIHEKGVIDGNAY